MNYTSNDIIQKLEQIRGVKLTDDETRKTELWTKGQHLKHLVAMQGWPIALDLLKSYVVGSVEQLVAVDPAKDDEVKAQHAISFVASRLLEIFQQDIQRIIDIGQETPKVIKEAVIKNQAPLENSL